jgi:hypothetical protein
MVDFNSGELLASNKSDILIFIILERRDKCINIFEKLIENKINNTSYYRTLKAQFKSALTSLYLDISETIERKIKTPEELKFIQDVLFSMEEIDDKDLLQTFRFINKVLDEMNLIKIDRYKDYDRTNIELENSEYGL